MTKAHNDFWRIKYLSGHSHQVLNALRVKDDIITSLTFKICYPSYLPLLPNTN